MCKTWGRMRIWIGIKMENRKRIRIWTGIKTMPIHNTGFTDVEASWHIILSCFSMETECQLWCWHKLCHPGYFFAAWRLAKLLIFYIRIYLMRTECFVLVNTLSLLCCHPRSYGTGTIVPYRIRIRKFLSLPNPLLFVRILLIFSSTK